MSLQSKSPILCWWSDSELQLTDHPDHLAAEMSEGIGEAALQDECRGGGWRECMAPVGTGQKEDGYGGSELRQIQSFHVRLCSLTRRLLIQWQPKVAARLNTPIERLFPLHRERGQTSFPFEEPQTVACTVQDAMAAISGL